MIDRVKILNMINNVPYYSERLEKYGENIAWENIPTIDKNIVRAHGSRFCKTTPPSKIEQSKTSGSTGMILTVSWEQKDYFRSLAQLWKARQRFGVLPSDLYGTNHAFIYDKNLNPICPKIIEKDSCVSFSKFTPWGVGKNVFSLPPSHLYDDSFFYRIFQ